MAKYRVTSPNGQIYEITAPDDASHDDVVSYAQKSFTPTVAGKGFTPTVAGKGFTPTVAGKGFTPNAGATWGAMDSAGTGVLQGLGDELKAGVSAAKEIITGGLPFGKAYDQALTAYRGARDQYQRENPVTSLAAEGGGALATGLLGGAAIKGAGLPLVESMGSWGNAATNAGIGAAQGGVFGFNEGEGGIDNRINAAEKGATVGGILGAVVPAALSGLGSLTQKAVSPISDRLWPETAASRQILKALKDRGMTIDDLQSELRRLGPQSTVADVIPNYAELVANTPGKGVEAARVMQERMEGQGQRLSDSVNKNLSSTDTVNATDQLMAQRSKDASPLYQQAFDSGPVHSDRLTQFLNDPIAQSGYRQGREIQRLEALANGEHFDPTDTAITSFNEAGDPTFGKVPNMRTLDAVKRGLDNMLDQYRDTVTGKTVFDQRGRAIDQVRKSYLSELDNLNGDYKAARQAWAGPSQAMDVMSQGRDFTNVDPRILSKIMDSMGEGNKQFFQAGVADKVKGIISRTQDGADATRRIFGNDRIRQQLQAVFPDEESFAAFTQDVEREAQFAKNRNQIVGNSRTAYRTSGQDEMGVDPLNAIGHAVMGNIPGATVSAAKSIVRYLKRPPSAVGDQASPMLFTQGDNSGVVQALRSKATAAGMTDQQRQGLARILGIGIGAESGGQQRR